jgi:hypothetical protein
MSMSDVAMLVSIAAILVMTWCAYTVQTLSAKVPGGMVGKEWGFLRMLVMLFLVGYLITPFFGKLPPELTTIVVSAIFFFGAVYVMVTVRLIFRIISVLSA